MDEMEKRILDLLKMADEAGNVLKTTTKRLLDAQRKWDMVSLAIATSTVSTNDNNIWLNIMRTEEGKEAYDLLKMAKLDDFMASMDYSRACRILEAQMLPAAHSKEFDDALQALIGKP